MNFKPTEQLEVRYFHEQQWRLMGRLVLKNRQIFFEYDADFIRLGLSLSPFKLRLQFPVLHCDDRVFEGLFGVFNDSLPDGWGRLLLDRKLIKEGVYPNELSPLDRLRYVGHRGMGALRYDPPITEPFSSSIKNDLDTIAEACYEFQSLETADNYIDELLQMNASSGGARPKINISLKKTNRLSFEITSDENLSDSNKEDWLIKFRSSSDLPDIGAIEYAYHLMAMAAGLDVPSARLFPSKKCRGYFGVKRFDRENNLRFHMHTLSGLLHTDHHIPNLDYQTLMKVTAYLTQNAIESEKQFRQIVFNVFSHNRDDHAKNFSFLMDDKGKWSISPAYDLTFSSGFAGQHNMTVMGEGKNPTAEHLLALAKASAIEKNKARGMIEEVKEAIMKWKKWATEANVSQKSLRLIHRRLSDV